MQIANAVILYHWVVVVYFFYQSGNDILFYDQVTAQSLLPDLEGFLRMDDELKDDEECQKWSKEEIVEDKVM